MQSGEVLRAGFYRRHSDATRVRRNGWKPR